MLLLPIGRDDGVIQRHAWITYGLIALNAFFFFAATWTAVGNDTRSRTLSAYKETMQYLVAHPYLTIPPELRRVLPDDADDQLKRATRWAPTGATRAAEQRELERLTAKLVDQLGDDPRIRYAYVPAEGSVWKMFTAMFMHGSLGHLFWNMVFLFAAGAFVEDVFGRPLYAALYLVGGIFSAVVYGQMHAMSTVPMLGASGAIAVIMGAFLVRFATSWVRFIFIPIIFRPRWNFQFSLPAAVVLPLWFLQQALALKLEGSSGVAFSAHVAGFAFGAVAALAIRLTGFEEKFIRPVIEGETTWKSDARLDRAFALRRKGEFDAARAELRSLIAAEPKNADALRLLLDLAYDSENAADLDAWAARLLAVYADSAQNDFADALIEELSDYGAPLPRFFTRATSYAERRGNAPLARKLCERACSDDPTTQAGVTAHLKLSALHEQAGNRDGARDALLRVRSHPACQGEWREKVEARLAALGGVPEPAPEAVPSNDLPWWAQPN